MAAFVPAKHLSLQDPALSLTRDRSGCSPPASSNDAAVAAERAGEAGSPSDGLDDEPPAPVSPPRGR